MCRSEHHTSRAACFAAVLLDSSGGCAAVRFSFAAASSAILLSRAFSFFRVSKQSFWDSSKLRFAIEGGKACFFSCKTEVRLACLGAEQYHSSDLSNINKA